MTRTFPTTGHQAAAAPVRLERDKGVARIVLARGNTGNAFDLELVTSLRDAVRQVADWTRDAERTDIGAVLLQAEGRNFSVGGDLRAFVAQGEDTGGYVQAVADAAHEAVLGIIDLRVPVVAAVRGAVAGGGVGLVLSADVVVAARSANMRLAYTALGLTPDCGASWFLPRIVGVHRALDLVLTNRVLAAADAERWGLFSRVVADEELSSATENLLRSIVTGQRGALSQAKLLVRTGLFDELPEHLEYEAEFIAKASARPEVRAAMEEFLNRTRAAR
ncbi:enoyl-CoA hydratase/isomerase family protein [Streptomyces griseorubiginosus]|uniref:enoyl-CoA hydratase/isomerase family protein n=1 Tax=Streptomyces griseorubiginosus TaxID=67304 RepID=UPI001AD79366|nr:enoyl-CoA hydratase/isomerase family protein [Streptomyces griseorubiginosus]MBO4256940.1 enoyl-CoA hydratase/isomerase family protein [Streptomyces griseorubiginosus]